MNITVPEPGARTFVLPSIPDTASLGLRAAVDRYTADFWGDDTAESGQRWTAAAHEIADFAAASLTDVAVKLLFVTHYISPDQDAGRPAIDLSALDVDGGRLLLRCAADVLTFAKGGC